MLCSQTCAISVINKISNKSASIFYLTSIHVVMVALLKHGISTPRRAAYFFTIRLNNLIIRTFWNTFWNTNAFQPALFFTFPFPGSLHCPLKNFTIPNSSLPGFPFRKCFSTGLPRHASVPRDRYKSSAENC